MADIKEAKTKVVHNGERTVIGSQPQGELSAVSYCETHYPEMMDEFKTILDEMYNTFARKQKNYGPSNISVGTSLETNDDIKLSLTGLWFRMTDKINRLKQLVVLGHSDEVGESIEDTYQDLAVYSVIAQIVSRKKWGK
jgi:peptide subunit release factor 1 (eRF1)